MSGYRMGWSRSAARRPLNRQHERKRLVGLFDSTPVLSASTCTRPPPSGCGVPSSRCRGGSAGAWAGASPPVSNSARSISRASRTASARRQSTAAIRKPPLPTVPWPEWLQSGLSPTGQHRDLTLLELATRRCHLPGSASSAICFSASLQSTSLRLAQLTRHRVRLVRIVSTLRGIYRILCCMTRYDACD